MSSRSYISTDDARPLACRPAESAPRASDHRKPFQGTTLTAFFASDYDAGFGAALPPGVNREDHR
jgi:hypothetical protein